MEVRAADGTLIILDAGTGKVLHKLAVQGRPLTMNFSADALTGTRYRKAFATDWRETTEAILTPASTSISTGDCGARWSFGPSSRTSRTRATSAANSWVSDYTSS